MKKNLSIFALSLFVLPALVFSADIENQKQTIVSAYKNVIEVANLNIVVPTVVELEINRSEIARTNFAVFDKTAEKFVSSMFRENYVSTKRPYNIITSDGQNLGKINDSNFLTAQDFALPQTGHGQITLIANYSEDLITDGLEVTLDRYVALPISVSVYSYDENGNKQFVVNSIKPNGGIINFPKVKAKKFGVEMTYVQPLRISEIRFSGAGTEVSNVSGLRFLAQPGNEYQVYMNADRYVEIKTGEAPNLLGTTNVKKISGLSSAVNLNYVKSDADADGVVDEADNCVNVANADQKDVDSNGRGDACDDFDSDGVINQVDNCVDQPNRGQQDIDNDGKGDTCDGEESRLTEKYPVIVWMAIVFAILVFVALFSLAIRSIRKQQEVKQETDQKNNQ